MIFADPLDLVRFARTHCPYYRDLYRDLPDEPRFGDVPPVDVPRYWAAKAEDFDSTLTRTPPDGYLWTTGGSTLQSKRVAVSAEDFAEEARAFGDAFLAAGMTAGDRVANLTWAGELSASFILTARVLEQLPVFQLPILGHTSPSRVVDLCRELRPTALLTFPFVAARVAHFLVERGETLPVDKLLYAGDRLYPDQRELLTRAFVPRVIAPFGYGAVDCGPIAAVDLALGEDVYRPLAGYSIVEILDDHGRPAPLGETGRLTITNLGRTLSPVIRYSPGDMGHWVVLPEADGRGGAFRLQQRDHLSIKVSFGIATHADIAREAAAIEGLSSIVQLVARREDGCDWLVVRVVPTLTGEAAERAGQLLLARLRSLFPALRDPEGAMPSPRLLLELCPADRMELTIAGKIKPVVETRSP